MTSTFLTLIRERQFGFSFETKGSFVGGSWFSNGILWGTLFGDSMGIQLHKEIIGEIFNGSGGNTLVKEGVWTTKRSCIVGHG